MTGSVASASNSTSGNLLVIAPNWLGDGIMAMPGLQALRATLPSETTITVAARAGQVAMWEMHPDVSRDRLGEHARGQRQRQCEVRMQRRSPPRPP